MKITVGENTYKLGQRLDTFVVEHNDLAVMGLHEGLMQIADTLVPMNKWGVQGTADGRLQIKSKPEDPWQTIGDLSIRDDRVSLTPWGYDDIELEVQVDPSSLRRVHLFLASVAVLSGLYKEPITSLAKMTADDTLYHTDFSLVRVGDKLYAEIPDKGKISIAVAPMPPHIGRHRFPMDELGVLWLRQEGRSFAVYVCGDRSPIKSMYSLDYERKGVLTVEENKEGDFFTVAFSVPRKSFKLHAELNHPALQLPAMIALPILARFDGRIDP